MMKMGRKPKPTSLHQLHGSLNVTRHRDRGLEPSAPGDLLDPPDYLSPVEQTRFRTILEIAPRGVLHLIDQAMLASYVIAEHRFAEINRALQREENDYLLTTSKNGMIMIAALHQFQMRAQTSLERAASHIGFTPVSRIGLKTDPGGAHAEDNRWAYLRRTASNG